MLGAALHPEAFRPAGWAMRPASAFFLALHPVLYVAADSLQPILARLHCECAKEPHAACFVGTDAHQMVRRLISCFSHDSRRDPKASYQAPCCMAQSSKLASALAATSRLPT